MVNLARTAAMPLAAAAILASASANGTVARGHSLTGYSGEQDRGNEKDGKASRGLGSRHQLRSWAAAKEDGFALFDYPSPTVGFSWATAQVAPPSGILAQEADRNSAISSELISFKELEDGWDGPGSVAPSPAAVDEALIFLDVIPKTSEDPDVMVAADGEVGFYWKNEGGFVDISFRGLGEASFFARTENGSVKGRVGVSLASSLPKSLLMAIESVGAA